MAAMITWADPSMAWATGLDGLLSWLAIWGADKPESTGRLDRLQRGDCLAGAHTGEHGGWDGGDLLDDDGGRLRFAGDRTNGGRGQLDRDQRHDDG